MNIISEYASSAMHSIVCGKDEIDLNWPKIEVLVGFRVTTNLIC